MRAAVWKTTPQPPSVGLLTLTICALIAASFGLLSQYIEAGANVRFSPYGLNSGLALSLLSFAIIAAFVRAQWRGYAAISPDAPVLCDLSPEDSDRACTATDRMGSYRTIVLDEQRYRHTFFSD